MRIVQNMLLVIGGLALGAVRACLLVGFVAYLLIRPNEGAPEGRGFGALGVIVAGVYCGAPIGALAGLVGAVRWIAHHESRPWSVFVWAGVAVGLLLGLAVSFRSLDRFLDAVFQPRNHELLWLSAPFVTAAGGTVGGILASMAIAVGTGAAGAGVSRKRRKQSTNGGRR